MDASLKFLFLLGRPGCGKSYLYNNVFVPAVMKKGVREVERLDDYPVLKDLLDRDVEFKRHIRKDGGFQVTDWTIVDDVLKEMDTIIRKKEQPGKIIMVEFARDNYLKALENFSEYVRDNSVLLYIWAPLETCINSNRDRFKNSKNLDDHIVPEALMNSYYRTDDIDRIFLDKKEHYPRSYSGWDLKVFNNSDRELSAERKQEIFTSMLEGYSL